MRVGSRGNAVTHMKLANPINREIASRFILAMVTVAGNSLKAKFRTKQLVDTTCKNVKTLEFTYTKESAWKIVDIILEITPTKLCHVQDELDRICHPLPKQLNNIGILKFLTGTLRNVSS